jgi:S-DNA-T family DNA segregation ATPase FtsK/SpoIIIE
VGLVTDLDQHLADRARVSLLAELRRREALLREEGVRGLRELRLARPESAPPHLLVVVDEFATLRREVPAFVDTLVDVAQRGRSLGLHLVLATQRPRGAVSDTIRANTNLRIAMRMSDAAESTDILEAPDAASIPGSAPGRAIALDGRRADGSPRLVPFQAAYAGGRTHLVDTDEVAVRRLRFGAQAERAERLVTAAGIELPTDLEGIVDAATLAAERLGLSPGRSPWLPALPEQLALADIAEAEPRRAAIALIDEPELQRRRPLVLDVEHDGSAIVYGTSRSGKTMLLRAVACALARGSSAREVHLYGLDFASRALGDLEHLPQCGAVIAGDDEERVLRLLGAIRRAMGSRRERLAAGGASAVAAAPSVVLLLDGYAGFASAFERMTAGDPVQALTRIAAEGRPLGIHVVLTADRRADVPGALAGVIPHRLVLRTADPDEGVALGLPRSVDTAELPPGRGFTQDGTEFQAALVEPEDVAAIAEAASRAHPHERAPRIGVLPAHVAAEGLPAPEAALAALLGVDGDLLRPVGVDLTDGDLLVAGPHRSGRSTALGAVAASLERGSPDVARHLLLPRRSPLADQTGWTSVAQGPEACAAALERLQAEPGPFVVILDDGTDLPDGPAATALEALLRRGRDEPVRLVAAVEVHAAQRAYGGWLRDLRTQQRGVLLQPEGEADGDLLATRLPRRGAGAWPAGRGYLVVRGAATLLQVAEP